MKPGKLLLIGGAPRSGTSMVLRMLDCHPQVATFPREADFIPLAVRGQLDSGWRDCRDLEFGRRKRVDALALRQLEDWGTEHTPLQTFEPAAFQTSFSAIWDGTGAEGGVMRFASALGSAFFAASPQMRMRYGDSAPDWFAFKKPFFAELLANTLFEREEPVHLLWIGRHWYGRYTSTKARRIKLAADKLIQPVGDLDYSSFQVLLGVLARRLATGLAARFPGRVTIIEYEDLLASPREGAAAMAEGIGIRFDECLLESTYLGQSIAMPSSFSAANSQIGGKDGTCQQERNEVTSTAEREYIDLLTGFVTEAALTPSWVLERLRAISAEAFPHESDANRAIRMAFAAGLTASDITARAGSFNDLIADESIVLL